MNQNQILSYYSLFLKYLRRNNKLDYFLLERIVKSRNKTGDGNEKSPSSESLILCSWKNYFNCTEQIACIFRTTLSEQSVSVTYWPRGSINVLQCPLLLLHLSRAISWLALQIFGKLEMERVSKILLTTMLASHSTTTCFIPPKVCSERFCRFITQLLFGTEPIYSSNCLPGNILL